MAVNVHFANDNISRQALLSWVNEKLSSKILKIEDLCNGVAYCQLFEQLFPGKIPMKRVKTSARTEYDCIVNFQILRAAFTRLSVDKVVPVDKLVKGRFQDNFEFMQWFKIFYETNSESICNEGAISNDKEQISSKKSSVDCPSTSQNDFVSNMSQIAFLDNEMKNVQDKISEVRNAKDFYLTKINYIEMLCQKNGGDPFSCKVLEILRKKEASPQLNITFRHHNSNLDEY